MLKLILAIFLIIAALAKAEENENSGSDSSDQFNNEDFDPDEDYCIYDPERLFYQNRETGAICCRGKVLPMINVVKPEVTGNCAISTKTKSNGTLNSAPLWCAYTCQLKKLGVISSDGNVDPEKFHDYLSVGISTSSREKLKIIMKKHLKCWKIKKHPKLPCYTPFAFQKCWKDAVKFLCTNGMPKENDFSAMAEVKFDYTNIVPSCYYDGHRAMPGCCHGQPLPWIIADIVGSIDKPEATKTCMDKLINTTEYFQCQSTCFLNGIGAVDESMEMNVKVFEKQIFKYFPSVKPSMWMNMLGPTFVFYDELQSDIHGWAHESREMFVRVCEFQHVILEVHVNKIEAYCEMTPEELQETFNKSDST